MALTPTLRTYLELERLMLILDEEGTSAVADSLRDIMDPLWYSMTEEDRRFLDDRAIGRIRSLEEIRVPSGSQVFGEAPPPPDVRVLPEHAITGWELTAA